MYVTFVHTFAHAVWVIIASDFLADTNDSLPPLLTICPVSKHCRLYSEASHQAATK